MSYDVDDIKKKIDEVSKEWHDCDEKRIMLNNLGKMLLSRMDQTKFREGVYLENEDFRIPSKFDRFIHIFGFCCWLRYDDDNYFDGTRKICLICGKVISSIFNRDHAEYYGYDDKKHPDLNFKELLKFIKAKIYLKEISKFIRECG